MKIKKLPNKVLKQTGELAPRTEAHRLIRDAIHDLSLQEKLKSVSINMGVWHGSTIIETDKGCEEVCSQCLAGVTMSRRCGIPLNDVLGYYDMPFKVRPQLVALDYFGVGNVMSGLKELGLTFNVSNNDIEKFQSLFNNITVSGVDVLIEYVRDFDVFIDINRVPSYHDDGSEQFKKAMLALADSLEACIKEGFITVNTIQMKSKRIHHKYKTRQGMSKNNQKSVDTSLSLIYPLLTSPPLP
jgi:hypothetical protein